jgi:hypothetical protein
VTELRVIKGGEPSDEEFAALVTVLAARAAEPDEPPAPLRRPLSPWVASGMVKGTRTKV